VIVNTFLKFVLKFIRDFALICFGGLDTPLKYFFCHLKIFLWQKPEALLGLKKNGYL
jgi:hypothetical protein